MKYYKQKEDTVQKLFNKTVEHGQDTWQYI